MALPSPPHASASSAQQTLARTSGAGWGSSQGDRKCGAARPSGAACVAGAVRAAAGQGP